MESLKSYFVTRSLLCVVTACGLAAPATVLPGCSSDDSNESSMASAASADAGDNQSTAGGGKGGSSSSSSSNSSQASQTKGDKPSNSSDAQKSKDAGTSSTASTSSSSPGSATYYDGIWQGMTSQNKPITIKILRRFLVHMQLGYENTADGDADAGTCEAAQDTAALSAMVPMRGNGYSLDETNATQEVTLMMTVSSADEAEGEFTVAEKNGCAKASATFKVSKQSKK